MNITKEKQLGMAIITVMLLTPPFWVVIAAPESFGLFTASIFLGLEVIIMIAFLIVVSILLLSGELKFSHIKEWLEK